MNIPSHINGRPVVAFVPWVAYLLGSVKSMHSCAVARVICEDYTRDYYVVWTAYFNDDTGQWTAENGHYALPYSKALAMLARRSGLDDT